MDIMIQLNVHKLGKSLTFSANSAALSLGSYGMGSPRKVRNFTGKPPYTGAIGRRNLSYNHLKNSETHNKRENHHDTCNNYTFLTDVKQCG